jgi:hypothetical protein
MTPPDPRPTARPRPDAPRKPGDDDRRDRRASDEQMPDPGVPGRDRLIENERRPMDPGVSDSHDA